MPPRTSQSHPLQVCGVQAPALPGWLGLTFCPGKRQSNALTGSWHRDLALDLDALHAWGATSVMTLMEDKELSDLGVPDLGKAVEARGMKWWHLPIVDGGVPDERFDSKWPTVGSEIRARLRRGDKIVIHCMGGLGRTGLVAAQILVELGVPVSRAVDTVRTARPGAIENSTQHRHVAHVVPLPAPSLELVDRIAGCLLGGAVGDALGAPVEFMHWLEIRAKYGPDGIRGLDDVAGIARVTDDTQMTLFTAEGLVRARVRGDERGLCHPPSVVHHAYLRWLATQGRTPKTEIGGDGWLFGVKALHHRRAPGNTCLSALASASHFGDLPNNDSKGCGGVMRVAPCGFWFGDVAHRFQLGADCARLTHGHPSGYLAAGYLAAVVAGLADGRAFESALDEADAVLAGHPGHEETAAAVAGARVAAAVGADRDTLATLGAGWVAEEALAIAIYCVLAEPDPLRTLALAVNHDGDSDSTGAIVGNLLGAMHGRAWLPAEWLDRLELRAEIERIAVELAWVSVGQHPLRDDYPGW